MFTLLAGQDVHIRGTVPELLAAIFSEPARSLATVLPACHPALVDIVDRALQLRLADRWPDARAMQTAVREAYQVIFGEPLPDGGLATKPPRHQVSHVALAAVSHGGVRGATTLAAPDGPGAIRIGRRYGRRVAVASAVLLAGLLGIAAAARDVRSDERSDESSDGTVGTSALLAALGEAPSGMPEIPTPPSSPIPALDVVAAPTFRAPPAPSAVPVVRAHHRSIYDRRN